MIQPPPIEELVDSLARGIGELGGNNNASHNQICFIGASTPYKTSWTVPFDLVLTGAIMHAGCCVSLNGGFANFAVLVNTSTVSFEHLFMFPVSSSLAAALGNPRIQVFANQILYIYMNVAGCVQLFWQPGLITV